MASSRKLPQTIAFPALTDENHEITSQESSQYNCIAWSVEDDTQWWWPVPDPPEFGYFWPESAPRTVTIEAFLTAFQTLGFEPCIDASLEVGCDKIALYALDARPTHAARQLSDGRWSSKLGNWFDIAHELHALDGPVYGAPAVFLRRSRERNNLI